MGKRNTLNTEARYGFLVPVRDTFRPQRGRSVWTFRCDCGEEKHLVASDVLRSGGTRSCGKCSLAAPKGRTKSLLFIKTAWTNMNIRAGKYRHLATARKCRTYEGVEVRVSRDEFKAWCLAQWDYISTLQRPSVDRLDGNGHYELSNMRVIELVANIQKEKLIAVDGMTRCSICRKTKPLESFDRDKRRKATGRTTTCSECGRAVRRCRSQARRALKGAA